MGVGAKLIHSRQGGSEAPGYERSNFTSAEALPGSAEACGVFVYEVWEQGQGNGFVQIIC